MNEPFIATNVVCEEGLTPQFRTYSQLFNPGPAQGLTSLNSSVKSSVFRSIFFWGRGGRGGGRSGCHCGFEVGEVWN